MTDFLKISSKDNSAVKLVAALQSSSKQRKKQGKFVLEGLRICDDAYQNGIAFDMLFFSESAYKRHFDAAQAFAQNSKCCYVISDAVFKKISDTDSPQGICAVVSHPEKISRVDKNGRYIALENLADPSNLGAISRTAEALGISGIIITDTACDPYSPKALRASMGTLLRMPIIITDDIAAFAKNNSLRLISCVVDNTALKINGVKFSSGDVIVIGNEANGITKELQSSSDLKVTIPMLGKAESLNAASAAAIALWEMMR